MPGHDIIVIGASTGGVEALTYLVKGLPADLPAAVFVVLHTPAHSRSALPLILSRSGPLPAIHPKHGEPIQNGHIYIAPPDHHLLIKPGTIHVVRGPTENGHRPAVDPLFRTAARSYGNYVIGVVLTGALDDGTAGLLAVKSRGGIAVVQDPEDAVYSGMPGSAIANVDVDHIVPVADLAALLVKLVHQPVDERETTPVSDAMEEESEMAEFSLDAIEDNDDRPGTPSGFACPSCGGALWELHDGKLTRFRCRVGHAFSPDTLLAEQSDALEEALWVALRALEERAALMEKMAAKGRHQGRGLAAELFDERSEEARKGAELIRQVLVSNLVNPAAAISSEVPPGRAS